MVFKQLSPSACNLSPTRTIFKPLGKGDGILESAVSEENIVGIRAQVLPIGRADSEYHFSIFAERESVILSQISETCDRSFLAGGLIPLPKNRTCSVFGLFLFILTPSLERAAERSEGTGVWAWPLRSQGT